MTIQRNLLKQVSNERLMNYLMDKGWTETPFGRDNVLLLTSPDKTYDVLIPAEEFIVDYLDIMERAINMVAAIDDISVHDVLVDLLSPPMIKLAEIQDVTNRLELLVDRYGEDVVLRDVLVLLKERERMLEVMAPICDAMNNTRRMDE